MAEARKRNQEISLPQAENPVFANAPPATDGANNVAVTAWPELVRLDFRISTNRIDLNPGQALELAFLIESRAQMVINRRGLGQPQAEPNDD